MVETRFNVAMTCEGCASAVKRILGKVDGAYCTVPTKGHCPIIIIICFSYGHVAFFSLLTRNRLFFHCPRRHRVQINDIAGVQSIDTNVEAKTVVVQADASVTPESMLEKLQKVLYILTYYDVTYQFQHHRAKAVCCCREKKKMHSSCFYYCFYFKIIVVFAVE